MNMSRYYEGIKDLGIGSVDHAYNFAKKHHDLTGATRKHSGDPYIVHPEGVAELAACYGGTETEIKAALAHDLLEDTPVTYEKLAAKFGEDVADIVAEITNNKDEIAKVGKEEYINKELVSISKPALYVKLCDMLYNMLDYPKIEQAARMIRNVEYLVDHRKLDDRENELIQSCMYAYARQAH